MQDIILPQDKDPLASVGRLVQLVLEIDLSGLLGKVQACTWDDGNRICILSRGDVSLNVADLKSPSELVQTKGGFVFNLFFQ